MPGIAISSFRALLLALAAGLFSGLVLWGFGDIPARIHAAILLSMSGMLSISETHFRGLSSELTAVLRRGNWSVWQLEEVSQVVPNLRKRVTNMWLMSALLKAAVGLIAALLLWDGLPSKYRWPNLFFGYAVLIFSVFLSWWAWKNFLRMEKSVDRLCTLEVEMREKKRLQAEIASGTPHDFSKDVIAQGYTSTPEPLSDLQFISEEKPKPLGVAQ
jgi:hypothetical protein